MRHEPQTTAQQIIAEIVANHLSSADRADREHERAAREIEIALGIAGFRIVRFDA